MARPTDVEDLSSADALNNLAGSVARGAGRGVPATGAGTVRANILSSAGRARWRFVAGIHRRVRQFLWGVPSIDSHRRAPQRHILLDVVNACRCWDHHF